MDKQYCVLLTKTFRGVTIIPHAEVFWGDIVELANLEYELGVLRGALRGDGVTSPLKILSPNLAGCIMHNAGRASFHLEIEDLVQVVAEVF